jgi:L-malate glycosyltransferase
MNLEVFIIEAIDPALPTMGGGETYSRNLIEYLSMHQAKPTLVGICHGNNVPLNNRVAFIPISRGKSSTGYQYFLRLMAKTPFIKIPASALIHAQRPEYMFPFVIFKRRNPKIITLHGRILEGVRLKRKKIIRSLYEIVESSALKHSDMIIAVDETTREFYQQQYPWIAEKMRVIPVGIDLNKFKLMDKNSLRQKYKIKHDDKVVIYVGRLEKEKNIDFLLESFKILELSAPEAMLILVGDGGERQRLEGLANSSGIKRIVFMGAQEPDRIPEILNCADVLALCSLFEGSPTVVKEALACGVPVVTNNVGDVSKVIRNEIAGKIVNRDTKEFARALTDVLLTEDREKTRIKCAGEATAFGFEKIGANTIDIYQELMSSRESKQKSATESKSL